MAPSFGKTPHELLLKPSIPRRYAPYPQNPIHRQFTPKSEFEPLSISTKPILGETIQNPPLKIHQRTLPRFLSNLWIMLNDQNIKCINWTGVDSFMVNSREELIRDVLPKFFKHNRLSSFTRQLHLYQFIKVKHKAVLEWSHIHLKRGDYASLFNIRRKLSTEDKKLQLVAEKLVRHVEAQQQKIVELQYRMGKLQNDLEKAQEMHHAMKKQFLDVQEILTALSCHGSNLNSPFREI